MRNLIIFILFLIFSFLINIVFYYVSSDYRNFLQSFKEEKLPIINNISLSDTGALNDEELNISIIEEIDDEELTIIKNPDKNEEVFVSNKNNKVEKREEVILGKSYKEVLKLFSSYNLQELEINTSLFDVTTEYPDNYLEYYSKGLTLYFFPTKTYSEVYDIFKVLEFELPFKVNKVDNFGDKSFYINLNDDINDNIIRLVISYRGVVFGLKIKKNEYNLIKEKLNSLNKIEEIKKDDFKNESEKIINNLGN